MAKGKLLHLYPYGQPARLLRSYRRESRVDRPCANCGNPILKGDAYEGEVLVSMIPPWRFGVLTTHINCAGNSIIDEPP